MKGDRKKLGSWSKAKTPKPNQARSSKSNPRLQRGSRSDQNSVRSSQASDDATFGTASSSAAAPAQAAPGWFSLPWLAVLLVVTSGSVGFIATSLLLKLPQVPDCPRIFWPLASATKRLYCAQIEAEKSSLAGWLRAISLVEALPDDHPLAPDIERQIEEWTAEIMESAEGKFQRGEIKKAIATARKIPRSVRADNSVEERVEVWQTIWSEAQKIDAETERQLRRSNWKEAFRVAVQLTNVDNEYWATTKYQETVDKIQTAREESRELEAAFAKQRSGGLDNWLAAIEQAEAIGPKSYVYKEALDLIEQTKNDLFNYAQELLTDHRWEELLEVARRLPASLELEEQADDWYQLASAGASADTGTIVALEVAIEEAERIETNSSVYYEAQELIERWHLEIEGLHYLIQARELARPGDITSLAAAIDQAELIPQVNPRYQEAQSEIGGWRSKIQTIEDQPILDRARAIASGGTIGAWEGAIAEARLISRGRALHQEAQNLIRRWRGNIERQEDQPILDQATSLAYAKNYPAAIDVAQQIGSGRVLYDEARGKIKAWQQEIRAQELLEQAYLAARWRTSDALAEAISIAQQIPASTEVQPESQQLINRWGRELLAIARDRASFSLEAAIEIAAKVPSQANIYQSAQAQISRWQEQLRPPEPPTVIPPSPSIETDVDIEEL